MIDFFVYFGYGDTADVAICNSPMHQRGLKLAQMRVSSVAKGGTRGNNPEDKSCVCIRKQIHD